MGGFGDLRIAIDYSIVVTNYEAGGDKVNVRGRKKDSSDKHTNQKNRCNYFGADKSYY